MFPRVVGSAKANACSLHKAILISLSVFSPLNEERFSFGGAAQGPLGENLTV
jgi:hypothetical protein